MKRCWFWTRVLEILKEGRMVFDGTGCLMYYRALELYGKHRTTALVG
jgi:hypothetical protein